MAKAAKKKVETAPDEVGEQIALSASFSSIEEMDDEPNPDVKTQQESVEPEPLITSPDWSDYVIRQFTNEELDNYGNPLIHGLRRVGRLLLGNVIQSRANVIRCPDVIATTSSRQQPAVVEYTLIIRWVKDVDIAYDAHFSDCADVTAENTDPEYYRFATAMASTRAEARAWRKALCLSKVSSEETTAVPMEEAAKDGCITYSQINFMNIQCNRKNIDVLKFINSGKKKYAQIEDIEYEIAAKMIEHLGSIQGKDTVAESIRGYDKNWRTNNEG